MDELKVFLQTTGPLIIVVFVLIMWMAGFSPSKQVRRLALGAIVLVGSVVYCILGFVGYLYWCGELTNCVP